MAKTTILIGAALIVLGVASFMTTGSPGHRHGTALIPAYAGLAFILLGALALGRPGWRKHVMHGVAVLALLGIAGTAGALAPAFRWIGGTAPAQPPAVIAKLLMLALCLLLLILCIRSFIVARILRRGSALEGP